MFSLIPPARLRAAPSDVAAAASPRRPAVILPGLGNNTGDYARLAAALRDDHGVPSVVARVSRPDWFRNAAGLADPSYWRGTLRPRPVLDWPPPKGVSGVIDQTRGLLYHVEENCAPAVYTPELRYVCIAGRYIEGVPLAGNSIATTEEIVAVDAPSDVAEAVMVSAEDKSARSGSTWRARFVGQGYKQVCGRADVWGDGVVPEISAHLEGALNISFDGVYHSPVGADDERPWYGSPEILEQWVHHLLS